MKAGDIIFTGIGVYAGWRIISRKTREAERHLNEVMSMMVVLDDKSSHDYSKTKVKEECINARTEIMNLSEFNPFKKTLMKKMDKVWEQVFGIKPKTF